MPTGRFTMAVDCRMPNETEELQRQSHMTIADGAPRSAGSESGLRAILRKARLDDAVDEAQPFVKMDERALD